MRRDGGHHVLAGIHDLRRRVVEDFAAVVTR
jgi:hypothetical protein